MLSETVNVVMVTLLDADAGGIAKTSMVGAIVSIMMEAALEAEMLPAASLAKA